MYSSINLLVLDEPTNHLDIDTREALEAALEDFNGTVVFISHDRYFINRLADRLYNIENGSLVEYCGNYDYFREKHKNILPDVQKEKEKKLPAPGRRVVRNVQGDGKRITELEVDIEGLEAEITLLKKLMDEPGNAADYIFLQKTNQELEEKESELNKLYARWEDSCKAYKI